MGWNTVLYSSQKKCSCYKTENLRIWVFGRLHGVYIYWFYTASYLLFALSYDINTGSRLSRIIWSIQKKTRNYTPRRNRPVVVVFLWSGFFSVFQYVLDTISDSGHHRGVRPTPFTNKQILNTTTIEWFIEVEGTWDYDFG